MYYVTTGTWQNDQNLLGRITSEVDHLNETNQFSRVEFRPIGATDIHRLYRQTKNNITKEFVFDKKQAIPQVTGVKEAYLGFLPAGEFLKLVRDDEGNIIRSLFYENIHDWQGYKGINQEIRVTLATGTRDRFVLMNNGITIIARMLQTTGDRFRIADFHVVNGCQTSYVLHYNSDRVTEAVGFHCGSFARKTRMLSSGYHGD